MSGETNMHHGAANMTSGAADMSHVVADMSRVVADTLHSVVNKATFTAFNLLMTNFENFSKCQLF